MVQNKKEVLQRSIVDISCRDFSYQQINKLYLGIIPKDIFKICKKKEKRKLELFMKAITMWTRSIRNEIDSHMTTMATDAKLNNIIMN